MKKILILPFLLILMSAKHPFYLSVTELKYNAKEKLIEGSVKLFTNDLEDALRKIHKHSIDLINPKDSVKTKAILEEYIAKRLLITTDGKARNYECIGFEREQEAIWVYLEIKNCPEPKRLTIENSLLYDYIKEQTNIVHVEMKGEKKSLKLSCPEKIVNFDF
jgi:hypothetical protein